MRKGNRQKGEALHFPDMSEDQDTAQATTSQQNISIQGTQIIQASRGESFKEPVCIGGTQIIQSGNRDKRSLQERWDEELSLNVKGKVWTSVCTEIQHHLQNNSITIVIGSPGEGKTTLAYLLLDDFKKRNWNIAIPQTNKEYFKIKQGYKTIFLFNDMFGAFDFDINSTKAWMKSFEDLKNRLDKQECENPDTNYPPLKIIFVLRDYIWNESRLKLGKYKSKLFREEDIFNMTISHKLLDDDKLQLLHTYEKKYKRTLPKKLVQDLISINIPHGFPHCCELLFSLPSVLERSHDFISSPIPFLNETLIQLCQDDIKQIVVGVLLMNGGSLQLKEINSKENLENQLRKMGSLSSELTTERYHQIKKTFKCFIGSYLKLGGTDIQFSHPSILQSAAVSMGIVDPAFLVNHCNLLILKTILKIKPKKDTTSDPQKAFVFIDESEMYLAVERFISEMSRCHLSDVLASTLFEDEAFVEHFFANLPNHVDLTQLKDKVTGQTIYFLASKAGKNVFLKELMARFQLTNRNAQDAIFGCCEYGNTKGLKLLIRRKDCLCLLSKHNEKGETPLLCAASNGHSVVCQRLLLNDINVNVQDKAGNTALHFAAENGIVGLVQNLVEKSCKLDIRNKNKQTALHLALLGGHCKTSRLLLDYGADFRLKEKMGLTAMHCASSTGLTKIVKYLIRKGADIHALNERGSPPVLKAAEGGHLETVRFLHKHGSSVHKANFKGYTALHLACQNGHVKVVKLLIKLGCNVNVKSKIGSTGLMLASFTGRQNIVELLIQHRCKLNTGDILGRTAIVYAFVGFQEDVARLLLGKGCSHYVLIHFSIRRSMKIVYNAMEAGSLKKALLKSIHPLYWLVDAIYGDILLLDVLYFVLLTCQHGLLVTLLDQDPDAVEWIHVFSPITILCGMANRKFYLRSLQNMSSRLFNNKSIDLSKLVPVAAELFRRGANVHEEDDKGATILHHAAAKGCVELMDVSLEAGGDTEKKDNQGQTPLHYAVWYGQMEAVKWLLRKNSDPYLVDSYGHTALHYAILNRHHAIVDLLKSEGCTLPMPICLLYSIPFVKEIRHVRVLPVTAYILAAGLWVGTTYWSYIYDSLPF